ncbi:cobyrinate a,c-diamide synthase [Nocardioides sp. LHG3406-4]|uniref:cobyrinate a,c-diamide synthase n=1 Tax=Nocardioides sp. LHG3406-4 TaxID=2804575 RepID=UPI003CEF2679
MRLPRLVVAAPATGQGKTTVSIGLMAALTRAGHVVSGHKVGPDYIDPGYHALACGRPGRNLDPHLVGEERIVPLLLHGASGAGVAVIEGVMGLYDGRIGGQGFASTAHVAALTRSPVVLVVDISRSSRSIGAVVHGMATFDDSVEIAGVILNKAGSPRHAAEVAASIALPVLGTVGRSESFGVPSRHLGLVPAAERDEATHTLDQLAQQIAEVVDLERVLQIAATAPDLDAAPWDPSVEVTRATGRRPVVAMAGGRAFTFRYAETEELLGAAGCDVVSFDPLTDRALPPDTAGIYLGGGFPEVHAAALGDNVPLLADLKAAIAAGTPTVAECAGLLYLCESVDGQAMVGALSATAQMTPRLTLGYSAATAPGDSLLTRAGELVTGHEFHRTHVDPPAGPSPAWSVDDRAIGFVSPTLHASYLHVHWAGHPHLAQRFADAVHAAVPHSPADVRAVVSRTVAPPAAVPDPLRHHGDVEAAAGLLDFAVNVFPGPPPPWLSAALQDSLERIGTYPDAASASAAAAARHGRPPDQALATAGAAEAFSLVARLRPWRHAVVVHPQFTEPHAALWQAGHRVTEVLCTPDTGFELDPTGVPDDADLVMIGNPTNPTGVLHPAQTILALLRPGRMVVVDEAFMDTVPGEAASLASEALPGLLVLRSLTKHWGIPGIRAGYLLGDPETVARLRQAQVPWSVSTSAAAAIVACTAPAAKGDAEERAQTLLGWRRDLESALRRLGVDHVPSSASYVLVRAGEGVHGRLREAGIAVRRADTFPGLGPAWVRIAARPRPQTERLLTALSHALG